MDIRAHVQALNSERIKAAKELNDHFDACVAAHPGQPMTAEERQTEDRINARIDELDAEVQRFVTQETREQESAKIREANAAVFGNPAGPQTPDALSQRQQFNLWAKGKAPGNAADEDGKPGFEVNLGRAANYVEAIRAGAGVPELRNAIWTTVDSGSLLVPTDLESTIYAYMTAPIAMMRMPTTKITTTGGNPIDFPKVTTHGIGTHVGEGTVIGGTDPVFGKMTLNSYKYGQLVELSTETIADDGVDIVGFVAANVARAVGEQIGTALVTGGGSGAPNGIETFVTNAAVSGGTVHGLVAGVSYENLVDLVYRVNGSYRARMAQCGFLTRDLTAGSLRKLRDGAGGTVGAVLWSPSLTQGIQGAEPDTLLGYPVWTDPNVASMASTKKVVYFGDWSAYYVRLAGGFRFERSDHAAFTSDEVAFRGLQRVDGDCIDGNAVNAIRVV